MSCHFKRITACLILGVGDFKSQSVIWWQLLLFEQILSTQWRSSCGDLLTASWCQSFFQCSNPSFPAQDLQDISCQVGLRGYQFHSAGVRTPPDWNAETVWTAETVWNGERFDLHS